MKIKNHLLHYDNGNAINYKSTPNKGRKYKPQYIVMHYTAATTARSTINWFMRKEAKASAHLLIDELGRITQFAPFNIVTWHAGRSSWYDLRGMNNYAIGIELVNGGKLSRINDTWVCPVDKQPVPNEEVLMASHKNESNTSAWQTYTQVQLTTAIEVAAAITRHYSIQDVLGHEDVSPGRKIDPGPAFPMDHFKSQVFGHAMDQEQTFMTTASLNVRTGAGTQYGTVCNPLQRGTIVSVLAKDNNWSLISVDQDQDGIIDIEGWVYNKYLHPRSA